MLINLIDNAIKYTLDGGSVTVAVYKETTTTAYFSCSDTGIGIADENIPRLFERFYRVDKGRSRSMGGTGLGLAIVKHIVMSMNGHIEVHSKLGEGTEFLDIASAVRWSDCTACYRSVDGLDGQRNWLTISAAHCHWLNTFESAPAVVYGLHI